MTTNSAELKRKFEEFAAKEAPGYLAMGYWSNGEYQSQTLQQWFKVFQAGCTAAQGEQSNYEELEREHLGDPDKRTGIYHPDVIAASQAGSAEQVSEEPHEVYTVRDWIEAAWCAGYYHAGYTHDSAYSQHQAKEFADHALAGLAALSAPERKVMTDDQIHALWQQSYQVALKEAGFFVGNADVAHMNQPVVFARALLNQKGEQTAPEGGSK